MLKHNGIHATVIVNSRQQGWGSFNIYSIDLPPFQLHD